MCQIWIKDVVIKSSGERIARNCRIEDSERYWPKIRTLQTPYSVGHIATTTTSLSDEGLAADMSGIIATIGNIDVEVLNIGPPKTK